MNQEINRDLLFLYWAGLATPMQRQLIDDWLRSPQHQELYYQWLVEWEEKHPQALSPIDARWTAFSERLDAEKTTPVLPLLAPVEDPRNWFRINWWMMAASVVVVLGIGFLFRNMLLYQTHQTAYGQVSTVQLPDGSEATLNANTELRVPRFRFGTGDRTVWLKGEADFSVKHQPDHQRFVVQTPNGVDVMVLGTEFVVSARSRQFKVALHSGKVVLQTTARPDNPSLTLKPGDVVTLQADGQVRRSNHQLTRNLTAWKKHRFVFDHHSLRDVLTMLNEQFGEKIQLDDDSTASYQITGEFQAEKADELLTIITGLTGYRIVTRNNQKYLVK